MKKINIAYIAVFLLICCIPLAVKLFVGTGSLIGNEKKNEFPQIVSENGVNRSFSKEADEWFSQENPLRVPLINAENTLKLSMLHGNSNGVIQGKNGWLFSEETLDDYWGVTLSRRGLYRIAKTVRLTQDAAERVGSRFVFTVIPNKNTLYPQYMPLRYIKGKSSNLSLLEEYLSRMGVSYTDMKTVLSGQEQEMYLRDDTHWNNLGALYGSNAILEQLGKEHKSYDGTSYSYRSDWVGDLTKMAFPESGRTCGQYYFDCSTDGVTFIQPRGEDNAALMEELMGDEEKKDGQIRTQNANTKGSLYMLRDSFGRAMLPYFINNYQRTVITRFTPFAVSSGYNDMVWEIVERNLDTLLDTAPRAIATAVEWQLPRNEIDSDDNVLYVNDSGSGNMKLYGTVSADMLDDECDLYVTLQSDASAFSYEAFPIYEKELLEGKDNDNGFSLLLNTEGLPQGSYAIYVSADGKKTTRTQLLKTIKI